AEPDKIAADFFGCLNRHSKTTRVVLQTTDHDADDFAFHVQEGRSGFATLRRQIYSQMRRREITAKIFSIEPCDHPEVGRLRQISGKTTSKAGGATSSSSDLPIGGAGGVVLIFNIAVPLRISATN